jgi:hypothetical protein
LNIKISDCEILEPTGLKQYLKGTVLDAGWTGVDEYFIDLFNLPSIYISQY